jgi:hypothetical protein
MKNIRSTYKGIILEAPSQYKLNILRKNIKKVEKQHNFLINSKYINNIKFAKTSQDCIGIYYNCSKTIKIDFDKGNCIKNIYYWFHRVFIHEYIHAIDYSNDFIISKTLFDHYLKSLKLVYKETNNRDFKFKRKKNVDYLKYNRFLNVCPNDFPYPPTGELNPILYKKGYGYDYCLSNPIEFAAVTMEIYFTNPSRLNQELFDLCTEIKEKYFN